MELGIVLDCVRGVASCNGDFTPNQGETMKQKVNTVGGGKKKMQIPRVGKVLWNGVTGELSIDADEAYLAVTKAVASLMLVSDQVVNLAVARADIYPTYGNPNTVQAVLTVVSANAGENVSHDPEAIQPMLPKLGDFAAKNGLLVTPTPKPKLTVEDGGADA